VISESPTVHQVRPRARTQNHGDPTARTTFATLRVSRRNRSLKLSLIVMRVLRFLVPAKIGSAYGRSMISFQASRTGRTK
jgi:hypothetical protein